MSHGTRVRSEVGTARPPATGRQEWRSADRNASPRVARGRPTQPHRSHRARYAMVGSGAGPLAGRRVRTPITRTGFAAARGSVGTYTGAAVGFAT